MVQDGQRANQKTFNDAFLSRTTDSDTVAAVGLNKATGSGALIPDAQAKINDNTDRIAQNETDIGVLQIEKENRSEKNQPNGYAGLDGTGRIDLGQMPIQSVVRQGNWDPTTNTPTLADSDSFDAGDQFYVTVAGTIDLGSGSITFAVGDTVTKNASGIWQKQNFAGVGSIDELSDVDTTTNPPSSDNQFLGWDTSTSNWIPKEVTAQENIAWVPQGTGAWDGTTNTFTFDTDCFLSVPPLDSDRHIVAAQSLTFPNDGDICFVTVNRAQTSPTNLTPTVVPMSVFVNDGNNIIIARRLGAEIFVGIHDPQRFQDGDQFDLSKGGGGGFSQAITFKQETVDMTGSGSFTGGQLTITRIGDVVNISSSQTLTFASSSDIDSASGVVPDWALPRGNEFNLPAFNTSGAIYRCLIQSDGTINLRIFNFSGTSFAQTSDAGVFNVTYTVDTSGTNAVENTNLSLQTVKARYTGASTSVTDTGEIAIQTILDFDSHNAYNTSTGVFTVPRDGVLEINHHYITNNLQTTIANRGLSASVYVNGSMEASFAHFRYQVANQLFQPIMGGNVKIDVVEGDLVDVRMFKSNTIGTAALSGDGNFNYTSFEMKPDFNLYGVFDAEGFFEAPVQTLPGTITWNSAAPAGTLVKNYKWFRRGKQVDLYFWWDYTGAAAANTFAFFDLPPDVPIPSTQDANSTITSAAGSAHIGNGGSVGTPCSCHFLNSTGRVYVVANGTLSSNEVHGHLRYYTD